MKPNLVITGATGFVGRQLVPRLKGYGHNLLLVGRCLDRLRDAFPDDEVCTYQELTDRASCYDAILHLAVLNNDAKAAEGAFEEANVTLLLDVVERAKRAGIDTFINVTTFHAIDENRSPYARSKAKAREALRNVQGLEVINIYLPAVYGDHFAGKLSLLALLPSPVRRGALMIFAALVPTVHIDRIAAFLDQRAPKAAEEIFLANPQAENPMFMASKRVIDLTFSVMVVLFLWWLLIITWVLVRLTSQGPGLFAQQRVGIAGSTFTCYKFRTMRLGTPDAATHEVSSGAVTPIGQLLRRSKIDELPQILNLLRGDMSLVGPRPCLPSQLDLIEARKAQGVHTVPPGITGLAQVQGIDMSNPKRLAQVDGRYVAQQGLLLDLKIIAMTMLAAGGGDRTKMRTGTV